MSYLFSCSQCIRTKGFLVWGPRKYFLVSLSSFFVCVSFMFIVHVRNCNLWWPEIISCEAVYCINTTEKTPNHVIPKICFQFPNSVFNSDLTSNSKLMRNTSHDLFITLNIFILLSCLLKAHFLLFFTSLFINNIY